MRYYISDLHFCHEMLNHRKDNRGFENAEAMNRYMIRQWNSRVKEEDEVIILGDFCKSKDGTKANELLNKLAGKKYLIVGNHDEYLEDDCFNRTLFVWIRPYYETEDNNRRIILSHYPIMCYNGQYKKDEAGVARTYMLYGHVHNTFDEYLVNEYQNRVRETTRTLFTIDKRIEQSKLPCQMINCFCQFSDYVPLTLDEWIEADQKRRSRIDINQWGQ